jgi:hypothetical protein
MRKPGPTSWAPSPAPWTISPSAPARLRSLLDLLDERVDQVRAAVCATPGGASRATTHRATVSWSHPGSSSAARYDPVRSNASKMRMARRHWKLGDLWGRQSHGHRHEASRTHASWRYPVVFRGITHACLVYVLALQRPSVRLRSDPEDFGVARTAQRVLAMVVKKPLAPTRQISMRRPRRPLPARCQGDLAPALLHPWSPTRLRPPSRRLAPWTSAGSPYPGLPSHSHGLPPPPARSPVVQGPARGSERRHRTRPSAVTLHDNRARSPTSRTLPQACSLARWRAREEAPRALRGSPPPESAPTLRRHPEGC